MKTSQQQRQQEQATSYPVLVTLENIDLGLKQLNLRQFKARYIAESEPVALVWSEVLDSTPTKRGWMLWPKEESVSRKLPSESSGTVCISATCMYCRRRPITTREILEDVLALLPRPRKTREDL